MFNSVGIILGMGGVLMGIVGGYLLLSTVFAGIQLISKRRKRRMLNQKIEQKTTKG